ncbi:GNAT family N-acetyltransferase [Flavobacterium sp. H4147]|uniref:GNAT family N-acetyltransferase n=1 Tax=Flavobacterium sp. H4147 TaxID=3034149 RepID=UPI0023EAA919|nr:GNAT family N-acetyltransferase [Flavobacterium sp. H4147]
MNFNLQPVLENDLCVLHPLEEKYFDALYEVASDPKIWEQHPNKDRWKKEVFEKFFEGAIQSKGAFKITDKETGKAIGSTRFYDYSAEDDCVFIGYTFYAVSCWGTGFNLSVKKTMLDYLFNYVSKVRFHIGAENVRSQIAISRLGAQKIAEEEVAYFGEKPKLNFVYEIEKKNWK